VFLIASPPVGLWLGCVGCQGSPAGCLGCRNTSDLDFTPKDCSLTINEIDRRTLATNGGRKRG
jgi:hypothetical protein